MKKQITHVSPVQTAKVAAALYFVITIPFAILFAIIAAVSPASGGFSVGIIFVAPFLYAAFGFIFTIFGAWIYNVVANQVGGIEFTTTESTNS